MKFRVLIVSSLLLVILAPAAAQTINRPQGPGARTGMASRLDRAETGFATVTGTVQTVESTAVRDAHVEIRDLTGVLVASGYSLPNGTFEFGNVPRGHYEVIATSGIQQARQEIDVNGSMTQVNLRIATAADDTSSDKNSVSVAEMQVPEKARKAAHRAEQAFQKHKLDEARKEVEKALQLAPQYARALTMRGVLHLNDNHFDQAQRDLETAIQSDPKFGMSYVVLGAVYNMQERYDDALRALRQGTSLVPNSWQAFFESAKALVGKAQFGESLRAVNRASQLMPSNYPPLHLVRAQALLGLKNYGEAIAELEQYLGGEPNGTDSEQARKTLNDVRAFLAQQKK
jgi:Tfp pilus assembly protein PilF